MVKATIYARPGGTAIAADPYKSSQVIKGRLSYRKIVNSTVGLTIAAFQANASGNLRLISHQEQLKLPIPIPA